MANTVWSTTDKSANVTVSGGNLIATTSGSFGFVRAVDKQVSGKVYWEVKPTVWAGGNTGHGFGPGGVASPSGVSAAGICLVFRTGNIWLNGANIGSTLGARANNDIIGIAIDYDNRLAWFRVAPSGNWNGSATANPATGVGGISVAAVAGGGIPAYPLATLDTNLDSVTANFGDSAFTGTPPAGFTAGFVAGATAPLNALATQIALEEWITTSPPAQVTQIAIEEWAVLAGGTAPPAATAKQYAVSVIT